MSESACKDREEVEEWEASFKEDGVEREVLGGSGVGEGWEECLC